MLAKDKKDIEGTFIFELFTHTTRFFGSRVVLLGRYNAQGLDKEYEHIVREYEISPGKLLSHLLTRKPYLFVVNLP
jgi:hypothetical protein